MESRSLAPGADRTNTVWLNVELWSSHIQDERGCGNARFWYIPQAFTRMR